MTGISYPLRGACRCGDCAFEIGSDPLITSACHCRGCQQMSSAPYSITAIMPGDAFRVTKGDPVPCGLKGEAIRHFGCPSCMTWMFTRLSFMPDVVNVRSVLLEDPRWTLPFMETQTAERLDWARTPASHSYERFPAPEEFPALIQAFAAASRRGAEG